MSSGLIAASEYIPKREALIVKVDASDYLIDYYLHRRTYAPDTNPVHDEKLKELTRGKRIDQAGFAAFHRGEVEAGKTIANGQHDSAPSDLGPAARRSARRGASGGRICGTAQNM